MPNDNKQQELDQFEEELFKTIFGEDYENNNLYRLATLTYGNRINEYISQFEGIMRPLMLDSGLVNNVKLREIVNAKYPGYGFMVPNSDFRLNSLLKIVKSILPLSWQKRIINNKILVWN